LTSWNEADLPLRVASRWSRVRPEKGRTNEASQVHGSADLARKHRIFEATIYNWKAEFGGMDVSEAKRLKALAEENAKLKKRLAEQIIDTAPCARARRQARCGRATPDGRHPGGNPRCKRPGASSLLERGR
jgi:hypothetical protein